MQFIDKAKIKISSGKGGNGVVAWRREKFVDKGGPAGGDGGRGGSVYLIADEGLSTLLDFTYRSIFKADNGENGFKKSMHGKSAKDLYIKVPAGTIVKDLKTGKEEKITLPKSNVLYYELANNEWCCARPSGTEPKVKFYMGVKGKTMEDADARLENLKEEVLKKVE